MTERDYYEILARVFQAVRTLSWAVEDFEAKLYDSALRNLRWAETWMLLAEERSW
jgi:hypothetical protein